MNRLQKIAQLVRSMDLDALLLTHEENMQYATLFPHLEGDGARAAQRGGRLLYGLPLH